MKQAKKKFDWAKFKGDRICVHCKTQKEAEQFCKLMDAHGMRWISGERYINKTRYELYEENTCYYGCGQYGNLIVANEYGKDIYMFSAYDFSD